MIIVGKSNCGKTNTLMNMLLRLLYYDKIYLYTNNQHQYKYQKLNEIMNNISNKVGHPVLEIKNHNEIINTTDYPKNNRKIVIFDNMINYNKQQDKIANHFIDDRHQNISTCYLSQSYDLDPKIRNNCSHMILFQPHSKTHESHCKKTDMFDQLKPYEFLFLDKENKNISNNFNEEIII